jgi:hypothetical protein
MSLSAEEKTYWTRNPRSNKLRALEFSFTPTNHFITRLKDVRTDALGIKSFKDLETIFRKGSILDADDGLLAIVHDGMAIIVNPQNGRLVTLTPWK